jgi:hypothetical protein
MPRLGRFVCWLLLVVSASGCADALAAAPATEAKPVYVMGRVTYRGQPLPGGQIVFVADPDYGAGTDLLAASIGLDGSFVLHDGQQVGLKPGYYRITVTSFHQSYLQLPRRYNDPTTSGLRCQIDPDQPLRLNIELN